MRQETRGADLTLICDGGSLGNPGHGYGSYRLIGRDGSDTTVRLDFGDNMTNNQAEYLTLIAGIEAALAEAEAMNRPPEDLRLAIRTDSQLLVNQIQGRWKVRHPGLQPLWARARELLARFGSVDIAWQPRAKTVQALGH